MPSVTVVDLDLEPLEDSDVVWISDTRERYSSYATCFTSQQAARLRKHKACDHEIPLQDPHPKIPTGAV